MAYEIRPMSVGEILDTGFRLLRNHFSLLVAISAIAYVPLGIVQFGLALIGRGADRSRPPRSSCRSLIVIGLMVLVIIVAFPLSATAMTMALGDLYVGRPTSVGKALRQSWSILLPVVGTNLLSSILIGLGMLFFIIPGIYLIFAYWLSPQVMVLERVFGMAALRRSSELMTDNKWRGFVIGLVVVALISVLQRRRAPGP